MESNLQRVNYLTGLKVKYQSDRAHFFTSKYWLSIELYLSKGSMPQKKEKLWKSFNASGSYIQKTGVPKVKFKLAMVMVMVLVMVIR